MGRCTSRRRTPSAGRRDAARPGVRVRRIRAGRGRAAEGAPRCAPWPRSRRRSANRWPRPRRATRPSTPRGPERRATAIAVPGSWPSCPGATPGDLRSGWRWADAGRRTTAWSSRSGSRTGSRSRASVVPWSTAIAGWARSWGAMALVLWVFRTNERRHPLLRTPGVRDPGGRTRCRARCAARRAGHGAQRSRV